MKTYACTAINHDHVHPPKGATPCTSNQALMLMGVFAICLVGCAYWLLRILGVKPQEVWREMKKRSFK